MGHKGEVLRQKIVAAADLLFYQQGYESTSFSDIAAAVNISRGNFYYHFKTKDEILKAVLHYREAAYHVLLEEWDKQYSDPEDRIRAYLGMLAANKDNIKNHGCPAGSLCTELAKVRHTLLRDANKQMSITRDWLIKQFKLMGHKKDAKSLAMHVLARTQGIATITNVFEDQKFLQQELKELEQWIDALDGAS